MAVFPKTVTLTSSYSALVYFVLFEIATAAVLSITLPSLSVSTNLSAKWRTIRSGLFVCCDLSHVCSRSATAFSVSPACDQAAVANKTATSEHHIKLLFIVDSLLLLGIQKKLRGCGVIGYPSARDIKMMRLPNGPVPPPLVIPLIFFGWNARHEAARKQMFLGTMISASTGGHKIRRVRW